MSKNFFICDSGVGKTNILLRIADDTFTETHLTTIGIEFNIKTVYIEGCHGVIIVYDVTDQRSFENVPSWIQDIERYANENVIKMVIGNKNDLVSRKVVDPFLAQEFADSLDITFKEISPRFSKGKVPKWSKSTVIPNGFQKVEYQSCQMGKTHRNSWFQKVKYHSGQYQP
ncbi:hypothetical protein ACTFIT_004262 [Dictyostelium discoideum]